MHSYLAITRRVCYGYFSKGLQDWNPHFPIPTLVMRICLLIVPLPCKSQITYTRVDIRPWPLYIAQHTAQLQGTFTLQNKTSKDDQVSQSNGTKIALQVFFCITVTVNLNSQNGTGQFPSEGSCKGMQGWWVYSPLKIYSLLTQFHKSTICLRLWEILAQLAQKEIVSSAF